MSSTESHGWFGGRLATGLVEVTDDLAALDSHGWWAVVVTFEGTVVCARFADVPTMEEDRNVSDQIVAVDGLLRDLVDAAEAAVGVLD